MEIHHGISQNTISFFVEKIFGFKVDGCPKKSPYLDADSLPRAIVLGRGNRYASESTSGPRS